MKGRPNSNGISYDLTMEWNYRERSMIAWNAEIELVAH